MNPGIFVAFSLEQATLKNSQEVIRVVTPAKAGVQKFFLFLDSPVKPGNDRKGVFTGFYEAIKTNELVKSPTRSLRGAKRRGNLTDARLVTRLPLLREPLGRELGAERLRGVYAEPVEGLAMTNGAFLDFLP